MHDQFESWEEGKGLLDDDIVHRLLPTQETEYVHNKDDGGDGKTYKHEKMMINLPLINILDPPSIRSVGAFNRCVFRFGATVSDGYQGIYVSLLIATIVGLILVGEDINLTPAYDRTELIYYVILIFLPTHAIPVLFWFVFYFYYGAMVNSAFPDLAMQMNEVGNILDSL